MLRKGLRFFFFIYLDQRVEASLSKHVLEKSVVLWAADMGLQLRRQSCQQLIQTCNKEEETDGWYGSGKYEYMHVHWRTKKHAYI